MRTFTRIARPGRATVLTALVACALVLGACGGADPTAPPTSAPGRVTVEVYFTNDTLGDPCEDVFPVGRSINAHDDLVRTTLEELLEGPTPTEQQQAYGGWFSDATAGMLLDVEVIDHTAHVTFADLRQVIPNASTSCGSSALLAQLDATLLALDGIDDTRYAIADQTAFYEWLQLTDPDAPPPEPEPEPEPAPAPSADGTEPAPSTDEAEADPPDAVAGELTTERIRDEIAAELATGYEASVDVEVTCHRSGPVRAGDVFVCDARSDQLPDTDWGSIVVVVVDRTTIAWSAGTDNPGSIDALLQTYADAAHGLYCRDLLVPDAIVHPFSGVGTVPQTAFFWSLVYWNLEGQPARMDADGNGVPCESLYDAVMIDEVVIEIEP